MPPLPVEFGNAGSLDTNGTGWIIGFSHWSKCEPYDLRHIPGGALSAGLCVKWFSHLAGDPNGQDKPVSTGRTMSVLVSDLSDFRIDFSADSTFPTNATMTHRLQRTGDYVIWGPGVYHRAFGLKAATIMTVRWEQEHCAD